MFAYACSLDASSRKSSGAEIFGLIAWILGTVTLTPILAQIGGQARRKADNGDFGLSTCKRIVEQLLGIRFSLSSFEVRRCPGTQMMIRMNLGDRYAGWSSMLN